MFKVISEKNTMLWYVIDGHNMEDRSNTVTSNIRKNNAVIRYRWSQHGRDIKHSTLQYQKKQCCDTLQMMVTTWKTDQTQWPPISEKNNAVILYRWSQHGREIKHSTLQYQKKQCCDTLQMVTTWKTDQTQYPPISEKQCCDTLQMMVTTTKKQPGRQIKRCFIQSR